MLLDIRVADLNKDGMWELIALLRRYGIPLAPLRVLAEKKKFNWLNDPKWIWHKPMFQTPACDARQSPGDKGVTPDFLP